MKYFICFSISLSTLWLLLISLQYAAITGWISIQLGHHLLSSFISFLWRKRNTNFDHLLHFPSGIFDQSCELSMLVFNFLFSSFTKESHEIVKLHWVSTKHIHTNFWRLLIHKFAHHPCNTDIIPPQIICMLLTFGTQDSHATSIITNAMYSIIILLQCVAGGGKKMIVLTFWTDIFEQDLFYHVIIGFYHQKILHQVCDKLLLLLCS